MTVLITLTIPPGGDAGPFNLYSDTDGYVLPFATGISALVLTAGFLATNVPPGTTIIRVISTGVCTNYIDIPINLITTTTTTSSSSTTSTTTTAVPTTTTTSSSSTSTTTSTTTVAPTTTTTTTEFIPNLNNGSSSVQANPATEGCDPLDYPYTPATFPFSPLLVAIRVTNLSVTWSDIEYVEIVSVTDDPNMVITYDGNVVAPAMQFIPATDSTWQYPLSMTIDTFSCINTSETWEIRVKLTGYPISNIADATINFLTNPYCPDCVSTTTTTTTAVPLSCIAYSATISSGTGNVGWTNCDGSPGFATVTPEEPAGFCAFENTPASSTPTVIISNDGPCSLAGCYTITFNPEFECSTSISNILVSYTECNGVEMLDVEIPAVGNTSVCALVGGSGLQPIITCGEGTITLGDPCIQLGLISPDSDPSNGCPLDMLTTCWISGTGEPNTGDVVYTNAAMTAVFPGDGNYYHLTIQSSTNTYSAIVNSFGEIQGVASICV